MAAVASCAYGSPTNVYQHGSFSRVEDHPYAAALLTKSDNANLYTCGATIYSALFVLTSANCVSGIHAADIIIRAGSIGFTGQDCNAQEREITDAFIPERESGNEGMEVIALAKVDVKFNFNNFVQPVVLPDSGIIPSPFAYELVSWSCSLEHTNTAENFHAFPNARKVSIIKFPILIYENYRQNNEADSPTKMGNSIIRTGGAKGDEGAGVVERSEGKFILRAIQASSNENGCNQRGKYNEYEDIWGYKDWIISKEQMRE